MLIVAISEHLYKVRIGIELMVVGKNEKEAIKIAKENAPEEIPEYGKGKAIGVTRFSDLPNDWKEVIPYSNSKATEKRTCWQIMEQIKDGIKKEELLKEEKTEQKPKKTKPKLSPKPVPTPGRKAGLSNPHDDVLRFKV